ncbi:hypothetical protein CC80DRAFT_419759 [Byssothecium circinans]|uniref:Uncharacterized protein n=1 Tax=Byssothecium circinans TaxID=147558 RepID=A0A6A5TP90_9PLEO|nr:hypothetical protein CC80DRAFT_419759 [Byssothecium circinans]
MTAQYPASKDPYALAYRYRELLAEKPKRRGEHFNSYYESLLANQPHPSHTAMDPRSRAIRYAKGHYECYYELKHVNLIIQFLDSKAVQSDARNAAM